MSRHRRKGARFRRPQQDHGTPNPLEHPALKRQPALAERLRGGRLDKLLPKDTLRIGSVAVSWAGYRTKGMPIVFIAWGELLHIRAKLTPLCQGPHKMAYM